jgi:hypothetical protein
MVEIGVFPVEQESPKGKDNEQKRQVKGKINRDNMGGICCSHYAKSIGGKK